MSTFTFGATPAASGSGTSLFGNNIQQQQQQQPQKSLFGGFQTPNPQQQNNTGSLFGNQPAQPSNPAFSFGNTNNAQSASTNTGGGLFGGQQQSQQQTGQGGSSLFGSTAQPTGSLFGNNSTQNQPSQPQQSSSSFGNTSNQNQAQQPQQTSLFGSTAQQPQQNSLFGSTSQQPQQSSLFGSTQQSQQQPQQQQQSSLFGNLNNQQPQQNSLFGSTTQQPQQSSLFGSSQQNSNNSGGLFSSQNQSSQMNLGQSQQQPSLFASTSNGLGRSIAQKPEFNVHERMQSIARAWDSNIPECRFKYYFYNVVEPQQVQQYGRPAGATDEAKWVKAVRENPDPSCMVPVLATGWGDVKKRVQLQEQVASVHQAKIKEISQALTHLSRQSNISASIRISSLQQSLTSLQHRLIHLATQSPSFIPSLQSASLRQEEIETKKTLDIVKSELDGKKPISKGLNGSIGVNALNGLGGTPRKGNGGGVKMIGQVNELWGLIEEIRRRKSKRGQSEGEGWLADERALQEITQILTTQQLALQKLSELANNAVFDTDVMRQGLGL